MHSSQYYSDWKDIRNSNDKSICTVLGKRVELPVIYIYIYIFVYVSYFFFKYFASRSGIEQ